MVNRFRQIVVCMTVFLCFVCFSISAYAEEFLDPQYGIKCSLPSGMEAVGTEEAENIVRYGFNSMESGSVEISIGDLYAEANNILQNSDMKKIKRSEFDCNIFSEEDIRQYLKNVEKNFELEKIEMTSAGEHEYWTCTGTYSYKTYHLVDGVEHSNTVRTPGKLDITVKDGYLISFFHFNYIVEKENHDMLASLDLSNIEIEENGHSQINVLWIALSVVMIVFVIGIIVVKRRKISKSVANKNDLNGIEIIRKYKELLDEGAITLEEYNKIKQKILNQR